jgi:glycosyltransferase involved in cell wall biosynthesis
MLSALSKSDQPISPLVISIWGNDFTLHAPANVFMKRYTAQALHNADALHVDCYRDLRLAKNWGFHGAKPSLVAPGAGGVQLDVFYPPSEQPSEQASEGLRVINPRGLRAYVNNEAFFRAVPKVLKFHPSTRFFCPAMAGRFQAERWLVENNVTHAVELMPKQTRKQMADLFRRAEIFVSPSNHDGTPNTLLEAMACGCFPVVGDLESLREWITPGVNGLLIDPNDPESLAEAILLTLDNPELRHDAREYNVRLIARRADYERVMNRAEGFYTKLVDDF